MEVPTSTRSTSKQSVDAPIAPASQTLSPRSATDTEFNEEESHASFLEALNEWREVSKFVVLVSSLSKLMQCAAA